MSPEPPLSVAIAEAVADAADVDPIELEPPLHDVIDVEALEAVYRGRNGSETDTDVVVQFTYNGRQVVVEGPQEVQVNEGPTVADEAARSSGVSHSD